MEDANNEWWRLIWLKEESRKSKVVSKTIYIERMQTKRVRNPRVTVTTTPEEEIMVELIFERISRSKVLWTCR